MGTVELAVLVGTMLPVADEAIDVAGVVDVEGDVLVAKVVGVSCASEEVGNNAASRNAVPDKDSIDVG